MDTHQISDRLDRLENKFDVLGSDIRQFAERQSRLEESVQWIKGHVKIVTTIGITILCAAILAAMKLTQ